MNNLGTFNAGGGKELNYRPELLDDTAQKMREATLAYVVTDPEIKGSGYFVSAVNALQWMAKELYDQTQLLLKSSAKLMDDLKITIITADQDAACKIERK